MFGSLSRDTFSIIVEKLVLDKCVNEIFALFSINEGLRKVVCYVLDKKKDILIDNTFLSTYYENYQKITDMHNFYLPNGTYVSEVKYGTYHHTEPLLYMKHDMNVNKKFGGSIPYYRTLNSIDVDLYLHHKKNKTYDSQEVLQGIVTVSKYDSNELQNIAYCDTPIYGSYLKSLFYFNMQYPEEFLLLYAEKIITNNTKFVIFPNYSEQLLDKYNDLFYFGSIDFELRDYSEKFIWKYHKFMNCAELSKKYKFTKEFLESYAFENIISLEHFSYNKFIPYEFLDTVPAGIDYSIVSEHIILDKNKLLEHKNLLANIDWDKVVSNQSLYYKFAKHFAMQLNWRIIINSIMFSESEIIKIFKNHLAYQEDIFMYQPMTETLIKKLQSLGIKIYWESISNNQNLSEEFMKEYSDFLNWKKIEINYT